MNKLSFSKLFFVLGAVTFMVTCVGKAPQETKEVVGTAAVQTQYSGIPNTITLYTRGSLDVNTYALKSISDITTSMDGKVTSSKSSVHDHPILHDRAYIQFFDPNDNAYDYLMMYLALPSGERSMVNSIFYDALGQLVSQFPNLPDNSVSFEYRIALTQDNLQLMSADGKDVNRFEGVIDHIKTQMDPNAIVTFAFKTPPKIEMDFIVNGQIQSSISLNSFMKTFALRAMLMSGALLEAEAMQQGILLTDHVGELSYSAFACHSHWFEWIGHTDCSSHHSSCGTAHSCPAAGVKFGIGDACVCECTTGVGCQ